MSAHDNVKTGKFVASRTAAQLPAVSCNLVKIKALMANTSPIYIGPSSVTRPSGPEPDATSGFEIAPGDETGWLPISNLQNLYAIAEHDGDKIVYLALT